MYSISNNYKNHIENDLSFSSKSKIVIDGIEYLGDVIKTTPIISHSNTKMIGGFPAKTCKFEIYDFNNELDLVDKEITVYRGLFIDGVTEFIPQGIFIPKAENITTNISQRTISLDNIQDKTQLFDVKYESNLDWSTRHTGLEIVQEICDKLGVELETEDFNFSSYNFLQPNFVENITYREVISRLAEIGGGIAFINRNGNLVIKTQTSTGHQVQRNRYNKLKKENQFIINTVVLGKDGIDDDIIFPYTIEEERMEWKIFDNPFVDLYREEMIEEVSQYIIGKSIIPFEMDEFIDGFYLDLNDVVSITDKHGNVFSGVILNYESTGRTKSKTGADVQSETQTNYNLAGSNKQQLNDVKLEVDHTKKRIQAIASEVDDTKERLTQTIMDINNIQNLFQITGGNNLIKDSQKLLSDEGMWEYGEAAVDTLFPSSDEFPSESLHPIEFYYNEADYIGGYDATLIGKTVSIAKIGVSNGRMSTSSTNITGLMVNSMYTLSFKISNDYNTTSKIKLIGNGNVVYDETFESEMDMEEITFNFIAQTSNYILEIQSTSTTNGYVYIYDLMLNKGDLMPWEPASGEIVSTTIKLSQLGVQVYSTGSEIATLMTSEGFTVRHFSNGTLYEIITEFNKDGFISKKGILEELQINKFDFKTITYQGYDTLILYKKESDS